MEANVMASTLDKNDGGPAFPSNFTLPENQGLTLRDYFAAKAMQALFDSDAGHMPIECPMIAEESYVMADAMLKARVK
jgi:hypothetical protein